MLRLVGEVHPFRQLVPQGKPSFSLERLAFGRDLPPICSWIRLSDSQSSVRGKNSAVIRRYHKQINVVRILIVTLVFSRIQIGLHLCRHDVWMKTKVGRNILGYFISVSWCDGPPVWSIYTEISVGGLLYILCKYRLTTPVLCYINHNYDRLVIFVLFWSHHTLLGGLLSVTGIIALNLVWSCRLLGKNVSRTLHRVNSFTQHCNEKEIMWNLWTNNVSKVYHTIS